MKLYEMCPETKSFLGALYPFQIYVFQSMRTYILSNSVNIHHFEVKSSHESANDVLDVTPYLQILSCEKLGTLFNNLGLSCSLLYRHLDILLV